MAYTDIDKPSDYFNTVTYTGNGGTQSVTGVNFQPDWTWIKVRSTTYNHRVFDVVRGVDTNYYKLFPNLNSAENTIQTNELTSLDSDGFTLGNSTNVNANGGSYVSWNWLAGGSPSSNSQGSVTSSVSANTTAGFSIVAWTGTGSVETVGHGLGSAPEYIALRRRDSAGSWYAYHKGIDASAPEDYYVQWHTTVAKTNSSTLFNDTSPTPTVFTTGTAIGSSQTFIAYCFRSIKGFSKMSSYVGNGSTNGTFVYTGFKPAYFMIKRTNTTGNWWIFDNKRDPDNDVTLELGVNLSNIEDGIGSASLDFLSNGLKLRTTQSDLNASGSTYIYMAFAENPFTTSTGIPTTAR